MRLIYAGLFKRVIDMVGAILALLLLSPLLVVIALVIRLGDGGPALFRQSRVGRHGEIFTMLKFRSMPVATPNLPSAAAGELTVTPVGKFIRRTNIDELPQLFNILSGDMSFIGPRPALAAQTTLLALRRERGVLMARPGLTGLAQVNSYHGMSESEKVHWEQRYVRRITLWGDITIVARTFVYLLKPPPVY